MKPYLLNVVLLVLVFSLIRCKPSSIAISSDKVLSYKAAIDDSTLYAEKSPYIMPYNRIIDPAGQSITFGEGTLENHSLDAVLLQDRKTVVVEDRFGIAFFDVIGRKLIHRWSYAKDSKYKSTMSTFSGITSIVYHDSTFIFWSAGGRDIFQGVSKDERDNSFVMQACWDGSVATLINIFPFKAEAPATIALPNQVITQVEYGELYFYTVLNGNNKVVKVRVKDKKILWSAQTGVAPYGITILNDKAFITNWAGPVPDSTNGKETAGIPWGAAYIDPKTGAMSEGSVSVIDTKSGKVEKEIKVGLHPTAIVPNPTTGNIFVTNGNSDYVSVINPQKRLVIDSIFVGLFGGTNSYIGSTPNALAFSNDGKILYVANGLDNAICVVDLASKSNGRNYTIKGYIPTQAYPSGIVVNNNELFVTNLEATGARAPHNAGSDIFGIEKDKKSINNQMAFNAHKQFASVSFIPLPNDEQLKAYTEKVRNQNLKFRLAATEQSPRKGIAPTPVPARIGEPSVFKHILYIIKENRTYDEVLGDMPEGRGMPSLTIFGDSVTPNQHKLAREYALMDNYHVSGKGSAEGHHWASAAMVTDYTEKSVRAWFRSYPHVLMDAMVYNKKGLIWNNALDHGKTVRIYGEACSFEYESEKYTWKKLYEMRKKKTLGDFKFKNTTTISRIRPFLSQTFPGGADETVNDQMRADDFIRELKEIESRPGDELPNLMIMALPNDHTAGTHPSFPTPRAMVADNDLAVGRIIEAIMSSRFAESTVIFITEDDSQAGWDHLSAYRTTGFVVSAYSRLKKTVRTNYNQTSMVRTMEQILGLPPMNVIDATALPMFDCFSDAPDFKYKYRAELNLIPLNEMNPDPKKLKGQALIYSEESVKHGFYQIDKGNDDLLNRILWFSVKGKQPYPVHYAGTAEADED